MKILLINWRSIKDPLSGGAEIATLEHTKRWVNQHQANVTWLSPSYDSKIQNEIIDGINFRYIGYPLKRDKLWQILLSYPVFYIAVLVFYFKDYRNRVDIVIDQAHGLPYLTPLYVREKIILYIHEVADSIWDKMFPFPISFLGKNIERLLLLFYRNQLVIAGSNSTRHDLLNMGLPEANIKVVEYGVTLPDELPNLPKEENITLVYLNRLVKMKGPERAIDIFAKFKAKHSAAKLWIIGRGDEDYIETLKLKVSELGLQEAIRFYGFVSQEEKFALLNKAHIYINTSYKEGWGLGNIEANSVGTPALAFAVGGNNDSIKNGVSGYTVDTEEEFLAKLDLLLEKHTALQVREYSKLFNWDVKANEFWDLIKK